MFFSLFLIISPIARSQNNYEVIGSGISEVDQARANLHAQTLEHHRSLMQKYTKVAKELQGEMQSAFNNKNLTTKQLDKADEKIAEILKSEIYGWHERDWSRAAAGGENYSMNEEDLLEDRFQKMDKEVSKAKKMTIEYRKISKSYTKNPTRKG